MRLYIGVILLIIVSSILLSQNIYSGENIYEIQTDTGVLRTDIDGNILGGDTKDWNFSKKNYMQRVIYDYLF